MKWDDTYEGAHKCYAWHDLLTDSGALLGYVRQTVGTDVFIAQINERAQQTMKFSNLEDAKAHIVTYYVTQKLEGT